MILILKAASKRQGFVSLNIMVFLLELIDHLVVQQTLVFGITVIAITTRLNMNILMFYFPCPSNTDLRISECLYILKFNPSINIDRSAVQLYIA